MEISQEWLDQNLWWIVLLGLWELYWKGQALWIAAREDNKSWFIVMLLINTVGLLPIYYIYLGSNQAQAKKHK